MSTRQRLYVLILAFLGIVIGVSLTQTWVSFWVHKEWFPVLWPLALGFLFLPLTCILGFLKAPLRVSLPVCYVWVYVAMFQSSYPSDNVWGKMYQVLLWTLTLGTANIVIVLLPALIVITLAISKGHKQLDAPNANRK